MLRTSAERKGGILHIAATHDRAFRRQERGADPKTGVGCVGMLPSRPGCTQQGLPGRIMGVGERHPTRMPEPQPEWGQ